MTLQDKLKIIHTWSQRFEITKIKGTPNAVTGTIHSSGQISKNGNFSMGGTYRVTCSSEAEVIHAAYRVIYEHVWCKVCKICQN